MIRDALLTIERRLAEGGVPEPRENAELLVAAVLDCERGRLPLLKSEELPGEAAERLETFVSRRLTREPLQYLLGEWPFLRLTLRVAPGALIPRPETEEWVAALCDMLGARFGEAPFLFADVGTGTGAIGLALVERFSRAHGLLVDRSADALDVARANLARYPNLACRLQLLRADLLEAVAENAVDLIVSNPPYVDHADMPTLQPEVRLFEPALALDGGTGGLELPRRLLAAAGSRLRSHGLFVMEHGHGQRASLLAHTPEDLDLVHAKDDLEGRERVLVWEKR
ncbi:MAG: peptide chain release factor N(5)-glutamine methyltransferase [Candidatus Ozemobacteraceae bacterium]